MGDLNLHTNTSKREINSDLYTITIMSSENVFLIWGGEGWVAGHLKTLLESQGKKVFTTTVRMQNREAVIAEIEKYKPTHILNAAGSTGRPNVDWCEDHKEETIRNNVIGTINLADVAYEKGVHVTVFATGCIYAYDETHPIGGPGYKETDKANFAGSFYSETKAHVEEIMKHYSNVLILRLRMPVSDDLHSRNFVTKIAKYDRVVDIPNSNTILHDLLPAAILMAEHKDLGIYNFTNPGAISHNEVLSLFKEYVRQTSPWMSKQRLSKLDEATASWIPPNWSTSSQSTISRCQRSTRLTRAASSVRLRLVSNKFAKIPLFLKVWKLLRF